MTRCIPAVLRLVQFATEAALRMRMPVSICGELGANPRMTPLLLGIGVRSFSMNAAAVPRVKQVVRSVEIDACVRLARRVMEQSDPETIKSIASRFRSAGGVMRKWPSCREDARLQPADRRGGPGLDR